MSSLQEVIKESLRIFNSWPKWKQTAAFEFLDNLPNKEQNREVLHWK